MKVEVTNFGPITNAKLNLSKFNLLFGPNNCGKTYLSYTIWGLINHIVKTLKFPISNQEVEVFLNQGMLSYRLDDELIQNILQNCVNSYHPIINKIFNCSEDYFKDILLTATDIETNHILPDNKKITKFQIGKDNEFIITLLKEDHKNVAVLTSEKKNTLDYPKEIFIDILGKVIADAHIKPIFSRAFSITSERTGVSLFYKNLDYNKSEAIDYILKNKNINPFTIFEKITSRYALPIQKNIDFVRDYEERSKRVSFIIKESDKYKELISAWKKVIGGDFLNHEDSILFKTFGQEKSVPLHLSSSATKSLLLIDAYLKHEIQMGDIFFIDEPELNLSPRNQVYIAQFLLELAKIGISVFLTTHSDYIVREINIFIQQDSFRTLKREDIACYSFDDFNNLNEIVIDDDGFNVSHFDNVISSQFERASL
jgi:energy-coupling factor transporter ATP-binding protein EcfA2